MKLNSPPNKLNKHPFYKYSLTRPHMIISYLIIIAFLILVVIPLVTVLARSFVDEGAFTLSHWERLVTQPFNETLLFGPMKNSLIISLISALFATAIGSSIAWLVVRTDIPLKSIITIFAIIPNIVPSWALALAWLLVFKTPDISGTGGLLHRIGLSPPQFISYGPFAIISVLTINYIAFSFFFVSVAFRKFDSNLEDNAAALGAGLFRRLRTITFPLVLPSLIASYVLIAATALGNFGVPYFLGEQVRYRVLATRLYRSVQQSNYGQAYGQTLVLVGLAVIMIWIYRVATIKSKKSFVTVSLKGMGSNIYKLKKYRWVVSILLVGFLSIIALGPLFMITAESFVEISGLYRLDNLTLHFWTGSPRPGTWDALSMPGVLTFSGTIRGIWNSFLLSLVGGIIVGISSFFIGYSIVKGNKIGGIIDQLSFVPYMLPGIVFGLVFLRTFARGFGPFPALYGSYILLLMAFVIRTVPFSSRIGSNIQTQIDPQLEEVSLSFGKWRHSFKNILLPLAKDGFFISFMLAFAAIIKDLDIIVLLASARMPVLAYYALAFQRDGYFQHWAAITLIILAVVFIVYLSAFLLGFNLFKRDV